MRKIKILLITMILTMSCSITVYAKENEENDEKLVSYAKEYIDTVEYVYGGRAYIDKENNINIENGLDCSGFVSVCVYHVTGELKNMSTATITKELNCEEITYDELKPGDLLFKEKPGSKNNHIGIYSGENNFIHNSSKYGSVVERDMSMIPWKYYYRIIW